MAEVPLALYRGGAGVYPAWMFALLITTKRIIHKVSLLFVLHFLTYSYPDAPGDARAELPL